MCCQEDSHKRMRLVFRRGPTELVVDKYFIPNKAVFSSYSVFDWTERHGAALFISFYLGHGSMMCWLTAVQLYRGKQNEFLYKTSSLSWLLHSRCSVLF